MIKKRKKPRFLSIVKFNWDAIPKEYHKSYKKFNLDSPALFLGEIPNMPGHVAVSTSNGKVIYGFHTEDFEECSEDEI